MRTGCRGCRRAEYGRDGLEVELPEANVVKCLSYQAARPVDDPQAAIRRVLAEPIGTPPLSELARGHRDDVIKVVLDWSAA